MCANKTRVEVAILCLVCIFLILSGGMRLFLDNEDLSFNIFTFARAIYLLIDAIIFVILWPLMICVLNCSIFFLWLLALYCCSRQKTDVNFLACLGQDIIRFVSQPGSLSGATGSILFLLIFLSMTIVFMSLVNVFCQHVSRKKFQLYVFYRRCSGITFICSDY